MKIRIPTLAVIAALLLAAPLVPAGMATGADAPYLPGITSNDPNPDGCVSCHKGEMSLKNKLAELKHRSIDGKVTVVPTDCNSCHNEEQGLDTIEANEKLGYASDLRDYGMGAQILCDLGVRRICLLTNNPKKVIGLDGYGLEIVEQLPISLPANPHNEKYLETKRVRMGHTL
jgi:3,4-dihydroxy 2-butanone 4-phosphate synthase/GTP cyclohydrolase II